MVVQLGFWESVLDLLRLRPIFILGLIPVGGFLFWMLKKDNRLPRTRTVLGTVLLYYYLCIIFTNIVGTPTLNEFFRLDSLGESIFNPNISLIPFNGVGLDTILNVFCFIPLGFLCPAISRSCLKLRNTVLTGFGLSLMIEISQLFTLYRATDIDDLITNVLGTIIGWLCLKLIVKIKIVKPQPGHADSSASDVSGALPVVVIAAAFVNTFFS